MSETFQKVRLEVLEAGMVWRVVLAAAKGNVIDAVMTGELSEVFTRARHEPGLKAILLTSGGSHFSFGASVEEHRPTQVAHMLTDFHAMFETIAQSAVPVVAAVRGQCLGGGLELAAYCHRVIAAPDAKLGQPEIVLGVFAPVASAILPERMGRGAAEDLLLSGRSIDAEQARIHGLVDQVAEDPEAEALDWIRQHLVPRSASSLRMAVRAARLDFDQRFRERIADLTRLYLDELMETADAVEGIEAFLAKRPPKWRNE